LAQVAQVAQQQRLVKMEQKEATAILLQTALLAVGLVRNKKLRRVMAVQAVAVQT
jgi:hypothetical protein